MLERYEGGITLFREGLVTLLRRRIGDRLTLIRPILNNRVSRGRIEREARFSEVVFFRYFISGIPFFLGNGDL